mmetsp:Transcript_24887/g.40104  ORF Transcript_24887/g.40104 Transcript_24887/m.40104 type:complete len:266 (+) Transcript_24887:82-879(+)|eukprot:jgi/Bigna1/56445/estExt_Genewise1Plus.C_990013
MMMEKTLLLSSSSSSSPSSSPLVIKTNVDVGGSACKRRRLAETTLAGCTKKGEVKAEIKSCTQDDSDLPVINSVKEPKANTSSCLSSSSTTSKRENYLSWDDYFMAVAMLSAKRSKDPSTQVGACIVNDERKIVGIGYNGFPTGCDDDHLPWSRKADCELNTKYPYVCHAEMNAIMNKNCSSLKGCTMYVGLFPCNECAKLIIQSGIRTVYYLSDKYHDLPAFIASRKLLEMAKVEHLRYVPKREGLTINFCDINQMVTPNKINK